MEMGSLRASVVGMTQTLEHPTAIDRLQDLQGLARVVRRDDEAEHRLGQGRRPRHRRADQDPRHRRSTTAPSASTCTSPTPASRVRPSSARADRRVGRGGRPVHRQGARRAGADRGHHRAAPRPRLRRGLRQGRRGVHREGAGTGDRHGRHHQCVEPVQRGDPDEGPAARHPRRA